METVQHRCYYCEIHARCDAIAQHQAQTNSASQWIIYCTSDFGSVLLLFLSHFLKRPRAVSPHVRCKLAAAPLTQSLKAFTRLISWTLPHEVRCPVFPLYSLLHRTKKKVKSCATPGALDAGELSSVLFVVRACSMRSTKKDWFTPPPAPSLDLSRWQDKTEGGGSENAVGRMALCVYSPTSRMSRAQLSSNASSELFLILSHLSRSPLRPLNKHECHSHLTFVSSRRDASLFADLLPKCDADTGPNVYVFSNVQSPNTPFWLRENGFHHK